MKVKVTEYTKKTFTLAEMPVVKKIINDCKDDGFTTEEMAKAAMGLFCHFKSKELEANGYFPIYKEEFKVFNAVAEVAKNNRVYDYWGDGTEHGDVYITWLAVNEYYGAAELGMYVSDINSIPCEYEDSADLYYHMYIGEYQPLKRNVNLG